MPRCKDCGLLAHRHRETRELREVEQLYRDNQTFSPVDADKNFAGGPLCVGMVETFSSSKADLHNQLESERPCVRFIKWQLGLTPREHLVMSFLYEIKEKLQREADERWQADAKQRQDELDRLTKWRDDDVQRIDKRHRSSLLVNAIVALCAAAITAAATLGGVALSRHVDRQPAPIQIPASQTQNNSD